MNENRRSKYFEKGRKKRKQGKRLRMEVGKERKKAIKIEEKEEKRKRGKKCHTPAPSPRL